MAMDTWTMDPQFTHSKLLEAATLLRLPVDLLADRLGLAPVVINTHVPLDSLNLPMPSRGTCRASLPWHLNTGCHVYSDQDPNTSLDSSPEATGLEVAHHAVGIPRLAQNPHVVNNTSRTVSPEIDNDLTRPLLLDPVAGPNVSPHWIGAEELSQRHGRHSTGDQQTGNHLMVPNPRAGTPSSSVSHPTVTDASSQVASSHQSYSTAITTICSVSPKGPEAKTSYTNDADEGEDQFAVTKEEAEAAITNVPSLGPCSKVWILPPRIQRRRKARPDNAGPPKRKRDANDVSNDRPKRRGRYTDQAKKQSTALTRILKSCIRCRMNRGRCDPDPDDLAGPCLTCKRMTGPTLCKMPCYRYIITDALLYREQRAPFQLYSKRWQSMDIVNIPSSDWASDEIRTIVVSPNHAYAPFQFQVREFIPADGDLVEEQWMTALGLQTIALPRYALADMQETARELKTFIETNTWNYMNTAVQQLDTLFWETYFMAFRHMGNAQTPKERALLTNTFRLWVTCRMISSPVHICGEDKLGGQAVYSPDSLHNGKVPMPVIMTAQFECINYTMFLRPWSKAVLKQLNDLVLAKKREYWLTVYLTMFMLLHSCSMLTRRDEETARQYNMKEQYANPETIRAHQSGMQTMLAHFHFINKGVAPFSLAHSAIGRQDLAKAAALDDEQVKFVWKTSAMVQETERASWIKEVRERGQVGDDFYWVSMLYDEEWKPTSND